MPSFTEKFLKTPHNAKIKSLIKNDEAFDLMASHLIAGRRHPARSSIMASILHAIDAGREWALQFLPVEKTSQRIFRVDAGPIAERVIREIGDRATKMLLGEQKGKSIKHSTLMENGKAIARHHVLETYIKSALVEWQGRGIKYCKRIELDDMKTCAICVHLNTREYEIAELVSIDNPLTRDTHPNCRGALVPIINNISKLVEAFNPDGMRFDLDTKNVVMRNAPIEYKPWLEQFFDRVRAPFEIEFDDALDHDYSLGKNVLRIRTDALHDEDPREIITEAMALKVPASVIRKTIRDYRNMMSMGVVTPPINTSDDEKLFTELYQGYLLNQLDDAMEVVYFKTFFDKTEWGKGNASNKQC